MHSVPVNISFVTSLHSAVKPSYFLALLTSEHFIAFIAVSYPGSFARRYRISVALKAECLVAPFTKHVIIAVATERLSALCTQDYSCCRVASCIDHKKVSNRCTHSRASRGTLHRRKTLCIHGRTSCRRFHTSKTKSLHSIA
jgi:hypothetical protein